MDQLDLFMQNLEPTSVRVPRPIVRHTEDEEYRVPWIGLDVPPVHGKCPVCDNYLTLEARPRQVRDEKNGGLVFMWHYDHDRAFGDGNNCICKEMCFAIHPQHFADQAIHYCEQILNWNTIHPRIKHEINRWRDAAIATKQLTDK